MKTNQFIKNLTSKNYKAYLLFLILTLILWFVIQMTKSYSYQNSVQIQLSNIPKHIVLDSSSQSLNLNIKANGLKLWKYNMSSNVLNIDFKEFKKDTAELRISANKIKNIVSKNHEFDEYDIILVEKPLTFHYKKKQTKVVPLRSNIDLNFSSGYNTIDSLKLIPDSVTISGSKNDIKTIRFITTDKIELKNLNDTLRGKIGLMKPEKNVELSKDKVEYYLPIEKFSENALMVDIEIKNIPDTLQLSIFPNQAKVSFLVSLKSFERVSKLDFKVICDYNQRYEEDAIMIPKLVEYPDNILNPKLHIRKVDYLIKQLP